jgi:Protein of unknown function (DUF4242)
VHPKKGYSPKCVEGLFSEVRIHGVLGSSPGIFLDLARLSDTRKAHRLLHWTITLRCRAPKERKFGTMPMFMDHHRHVEGLTADAVADAHRKDEEIQDEYGVKYLKYWFNENTGEVFCLADAPNKEAAEAVHREAHGLIADEITEVEEGAV